ncbi:DUF4313 domain-containing protein [Staphylococcus cohnii]|uniref:Uncharacterized protein n=1 Tax=Staphylococcus cohnii subsp. cohnii TaxID=74704 RepID=A0A0M2P3G8_STACC|nr:DUF4313 domain-containing protein [Staphylococcus cohnii]KKI64770.1 hypothetical protein UF66_2291 [Staphylococcus cohnii subsp. cohnii]
MVKKEFGNLNVELVKGNYVNNRLAINMLETDTQNMVGSLTVNIPEAMFFGETTGDENSNEALVNHIDGFNYDYILQWLEDNNLIEINSFVGEIKNGFNFYKGVKFKSDIVKNMRTINEIKREHLVLSFFKIINRCSF